ncbi:unnamed protein product [Closterium sp. NIES-54]
MAPVPAPPATGPRALAPLAPAACPALRGPPLRPLTRPALPFAAPYATPSTTLYAAPFAAPYAAPLTRPPTRPPLRGPLRGSTYATLPRPRRDPVPDLPRPRRDPVPDLPRPKPCPGPVAAPSRTCPGPDPVPALPQPRRSPIPDLPRPRPCTSPDPAPSRPRPGPALAPLQPRPGPTSPLLSCTAAAPVMASPSVLTFDAEGRAVDFDVWLDDLQLFLQCDSKDGLSLFDLTSGTSTAPAATADSTVRSEWTTRDTFARLAVRSHLPPVERAHFGQYKTAQSLYDAVVARYSSPSTAALSRLMLPKLVVASVGSSRAPVRPRQFSSFASGTLGVGGLGVRVPFPDSAELPRWHDLLLQNVPIFDLDFDAILAAMYALADITEGDCYLSVPPDPGTAAAALGASAAAALGASASAAPGAGTSTLSGTTPIEALHTFTLDSGASCSSLEIARRTAAAWCRCTETATGQ